MYTQSNIQIGENLQLEVNAYWVTIYIQGRVVFKRWPTEGEWLDAKHKRIIAALESLEKAIKDAVTE